MSGSGVGRTAFTVTGAGASPSPSSSRLTAAATAVPAFVRTESATLLHRHPHVRRGVRGRRRREGQALYARTRASYERIEPVAERFGTLDAKLDAREADVAAGTTWTGWHRIEKGLWPPAGSAAPGAADRAAQAKTLVSLTEQLVAKVDAKSFTLTAAEVSNGAIGLLDEVAATKITGEEEVFSHTDLSDFRANVDGAERAYRGLRDVAKAKDPALVRDARRPVRRARRPAAPARHGRRRLRVLHEPHEGAGEGPVRRRERRRRAAVRPSPRRCCGDAGARRPDQRTEDEAPRAVSRRGLLSALGIGALGAGVGAAAAAGGEVAVRAATGNAPASDRIVPFHGVHQAGITTASQDRLHFAAFDVAEGVDRAGLVALLTDLDRGGGPDDRGSRGRHRPGLRRRVRGAAR